MIKEFLLVFLIIMVHELGHLLASKIFKWNLLKIAIYPFGGCVYFDEKISRSIKEELIILLSGPALQIIFYFIIFILIENNIEVMSYRNFELFKMYNYTLLIFNLLPIYPLDGGRIINLLVNYFMPYKKGNKLVIIFSIVFILILLLSYKNLNFTLMGVLLLFELLIYLKRQNYLYNKLLLEKHLNKFSYKKLKIIKNKDSMYKNKRHIILYKNKYITEKDYLNKRFKVEK